MLSWQNDDGGWATYEKKRAGDVARALNPSQVFGDIMVDYSYVECTSACVQALLAAKRRFPGDREDALDRAIARGVEFIRERGSGPTAASRAAGRSASPTAPGSR